MDLNTIITIFNTIINIIILIVVPLLFYSARSYVTEKGKNLATKEDVEEITDKIESVKSKYGTEMEKLKSYIQIAVGNESMIQEKTNEALIQFFEDSLLLHDGKLTINIGSFPMDEGETLLEYWDSTGNLFIKIFADYYKLLMYLEETNPIIVTAKEIFNTYHEIHEIFKEDFFYIKLGLTSMNKAFLSKDTARFNEELVKNKETWEKYVKKIGPLNESVKSNLEQYVIHLNDYFKSICHETTIKNLP